jgi:hypothetical protein
VLFLPQSRKRPHGPIGRMVEITKNLVSSVSERDTPGYPDPNISVFAGKNRGKSQFLRQKTYPDVTDPGEHEFRGFIVP